MFFIPIVAGWALGVTSAKLVDHRRERHGVRITALSSAMPSPMVEETQVEASPSPRIGRGGRGVRAVSAVSSVYRLAFYHW